MYLYNTNVKVVVIVVLVVTVVVVVLGREAVARCTVMVIYSSSGSDSRSSYSD